MNTDTNTEMKSLKESTTLQGTTRCTEVHVDHHNHLYNGRYMDLIIKILKKNMLPTLQETLKTKTILLENLQYSEKILFMKEILKWGFWYKITLEPKEKSLHLIGTFQQKDQQTTQFTVDLRNQDGNKESSSQEQKEKEGLQLLSQKRDKHELTSTCIEGKVSTQTLKGLMEVERGRYLSLLLTGSEDYYAMMKEKGIAFISYASTFTYYQPLFPGQLYTIETYFPSNKVNKENLKLPFYQEMRNAEGNIIATSENSMVQISLQEQSSKRPYKTLIKNL